MEASGEGFEDFALTAEEEQQIQGGEVTAAEPEPAKVEEPATAPAEPAPAAQPEPAKEQKMVPLAALHEARANIQEMRQRIQMREQAEQLLKQEMLALKESLKPPEPKAPAFEEDPFGATKVGFEHVARGFEQLQAELKQRDELIANLAQQQQQQQFMSAVQLSEQQFRMKVPDYDEAFKYLTEVKVKEFQCQGLTDPQQIGAALQQSAVNATVAALRSGRNPAEAMYETAKLYGYKGPQAAAPAPEAAPAVQPAPVTAQAQQAQQRFAQVEAGQQAAKSLTGGKEIANSTVESLLALDGDAFDQQWKEIFGR
jgi:hypothetical protein